MTAGNKDSSQCISASEAEESILAWLKCKCMGAVLIHAPKVEEDSCRQSASDSCREQRAALFQQNEFLTP